MTRPPLATKRAARKTGRIAETPAESPPAPAGYVALTHGQITPDPLNARKDFDAAALAELADSMMNAGLLQAPVVTEIDGAHQLVMGERRWRAWGLLIDDGRWALDHTELCRLENVDEEARMQAALIENLQRVDLNHMEAGAAFELLAARHHLSNKEIAARIGRSPEFVQQHRRLTALSEEDQDAVRDGQLSMHEALRLLARPKPAALSPIQRLILGEVLHKGAVAPMGGYSTGTQCDFNAATGPAEDLVNRRMLNFDARDWSTQKAVIGIGYEARQHLDETLRACRLEGPEAIEALRSLRADAGVESPENRYATAWLNPPFALHPDAEAELEKRKKIREETKADQAEAKAKRERARVGLDAAVADLKHLTPSTTIADRQLAHLFSERKIAFPLKAHASGVAVDARGKTLFGAHWRLGEDREITMAMIVEALNHYVGQIAPPIVEEPIEVSAALETTLAAFDDEAEAA